MKWLLGLLAPYRSGLIAFAGVLFVAMLSAMAMGYMQIRAAESTIDRQATRITDLTEINQGWQKHAAEQDRIRALEQQNALLLQEKLALIEDHYSVTSKQLKDLEASNAEVKEFLGQRLPNDLRRLLQQK